MQEVLLSESGQVNYEIMDCQATAIQLPSLGGQAMRGEERSFSSTSLDIYHPSTRGHMDSIARQRGRAPADQGTGQTFCLEGVCGLLPRDDH
jgi:hypothetical protein